MWIEFANMPCHLQRILLARLKIVHINKVLQCQGVFLIDLDRPVQKYLGLGVFRLLDKSSAEAT